MAASRRKSMYYLAPCYRRIELLTNSSLSCRTSFVFLFLFFSRTFRKPRTHLPKVPRKWLIKPSHRIREASKPLSATFLEVNNPDDNTVLAGMLRDLSATERVRLNLIISSRENRLCSSSKGSKGR